mmetsp:Transcript_56743/g.101196  ORF Transcript_56743/g.101196 Transcript_56743/m.101196 type:complete len:261 (-) Transcript_56743:359-1141(-)
MTCEPKAVSLTQKTMGISTRIYSGKTDLRPLRPAGETPNLDNDLPPSDNLPGKERCVHHIDGDVDAAGRLVTFLHGGNQPSGNGPARHHGSPDVQMGTREQLADTEVCIHRSNNGRTDTHGKDGRASCPVLVPVVASSQLLALCLEIGNLLLEGDDGLEDGLVGAADVAILEGVCSTSLQWGAKFGSSSGDLGLGSGDGSANGPGIPPLEALVSSKQGQGEHGRHGGRVDQRGGSACSEGCLSLRGCKHVEGRCNQSTSH